MKKYNTKNSFIRLSIATLCFAIAFFAYSCKKDVKVNTDVPAPLQPQISQAKTWYENLYPKKKTGNLSVNDIGNGSLDLSQLATPDWNDPSTYSRFEDDVIEMPLDSASKLGIGLSTASAGPAVYNNNYSRSSFLLLKKFDKYTPIL